MTNKINYKKKHLKITFLTIIAGISTILPFNIPSIIFAIIVTVPIVLFNGPYEKVDELVENNLNKANKFTMLFLLIMLMIFYILQNNRIVLSANVFSCTACIAVSIRSIIFLWFDRNVSMDMGE